MSIIQLLSDLPFNPSLIGRVAGYSKRLEREVWWRELGVVLLVATIVVQVVAYFTVDYLWARGVAVVLGIITLVAVILWLRARLLRKELHIVRKEYGKEA